MKTYKVDESGLLYDYPRDKTGRQILPGDTIKVFHFMGSRRKKYYMYKYVKGVKTMSGWKKPKLEVSHLNLRGGGYFLEIDGKLREEIEIVQGFGTNSESFENRPQKVV